MPGVLTEFKLHIVVIRSSDPGVLLESEYKLTGMWLLNTMSHLNFSTCRLPFPAILLFKTNNRG